MNSSNYIRRQLTLFVAGDDAAFIEAIREQYNPLQKALIDCHVTLCREDEIEALDKVIANLAVLRQPPITISFNPPIRFADGKGVLIPAAKNNHAFHELRQAILRNAVSGVRPHEPHITLMHPRNSTCTNEIFEAIGRHPYPKSLHFHKISLIEQANGGVWKILQEFRFSSPGG